jgi:uncharacterized protein (DUF2147 family)
MRKLPLLAFLVFSLLPATARPADASPKPAAAAASPGDALVGRWKASEGGLVATISVADGKYAGVVVESPEKPALVGKPMFRGLAYDAGSSAWSGEVYAPKRDEFVPATIHLAKDGFVLKAGKGFMSKTMNWTKQ